MACCMRGRVIIQHRLCHRCKSLSLSPRLLCNRRQGWERSCNFQEVLLSDRLVCVVPQPIWSGHHLSSWLLRLMLLLLVLLVVLPLLLLCLCWRLLGHELSPTRLLLQPLRDASRADERAACLTLLASKCLPGVALLPEVPAMDTRLPMAECLCVVSRPLSTSVLAHLADVVGGLVRCQLRALPICCFCCCCCCCCCGGCCAQCCRACCCLLCCRCSAAAAALLGVHILLDDCAELLFKRYLRIVKSSSSWSFSWKAERRVENVARDASNQLPKEQDYQQQGPLPAAGAGAAACVTSATGRMYLRALSSTSRRRSSGSMLVKSRLSRCC